MIMYLLDYNVSNDMNPLSSMRHKTCKIKVANQKLLLKVDEYVNGER